MLTAHLRRIMLGVLLALVVFAVGGVLTGVALMSVIGAMLFAVGGSFPTFLLAIGAMAGLTVGLGVLAIELVVRWDHFKAHMTVYIPRWT